MVTVNVHPDPWALKDRKAQLVRQVLSVLQDLRAQWEQLAQLVRLARLELKVLLAPRG